MCENVNANVYMSVNKNMGMNVRMRVLVWVWELGQKLGTLSVQPNQIQWQRYVYIRELGVWNPMSSPILMTKVCVWMKMWESESINENVYV